MSHIVSRPVGLAAWQWSLWAVRAATAAGLAIDGYVHLNLSAPSPTCDPVWFPEKKAAGQDRAHSNSDPHERQCSHRRYRNMTSKPTPATQDMRSRGTRPAVLGSLIVGLAAVAAAGLIAACSSGSSSAAAAGGSTQQAGGGTQQAAAGLTVSSRQVSGAGTVLANQSGRTLYSPEQEANGSIKCTGSCLSFWFPVTMTQGATPHAASGVTGKLGSVKRPDNGDLQLTYNGDPLYTFRLDSAPGQAHGNNFTDSFGGQAFLWHVATVSGAAPGGGQPANPSGNSGYSYQGGGY